MRYAAGSFRDSRPPWSLRPCLQRSSKVLPSGQRRTSKPVLHLPSGQWPMPGCGTSLCQRAMRAQFPERPSAAPSRPRRPTAHPPSGDNGDIIHYPPPAAQLRPLPIEPANDLLSTNFTNTNKIRVIRVGNILRVPDNRIKFGVEVCHVLEYDTEQQVTGSHLPCAWETFENLHEPSREAHARTRV